MNLTIFEKMFSRLSKIGAKKYYVTDLAKAGAGERLIKDFLRDFATIDILVTNTGGPARGAAGGR